MRGAPAIESHLRGLLYENHLNLKAGTLNPNNLFLSRDAKKRFLMSYFLYLYIRVFSNVLLNANEMFKNIQNKLWGSHRNKEADLMQCPGLEPWWFWVKQAG